MSNASDGEDALEVVADGVRVRKGFEAEEFPVPAIKFAITSEREEPVTVRIADRIPEAFSMDGVGFHPDYESENWTAFQDHRVEYERTLQPDEKVVTVYGIRAGTMDEVQQFLVEPGVKTVQPTGDDRADGSDTVDNTIQDIAPKESTEVVREYISGDREAIPGMDDDGTVAPESQEAAGPADVGAEEAVAGGEESGDELDGLGLDDDDAENLLGDIDFDEESAADGEPEPADDEAEPLEIGFDEETDSGTPAEDESADSEVDEMAEDIDFGEVPQTNDLEDDDTPATEAQDVAAPDEAETDTAATGAEDTLAGSDDDTGATAAGESSSGAPGDGQVSEETATSDAEDDIGLDLGEADELGSETVVPDGQSVESPPEESGTSGPPQDTSDSPSVESPSAVDEDDAVGEDDTATSVGTVEGDGTTSPTTETSGRPDTGDEEPPESTDPAGHDATGAAATDEGSVAAALAAEIRAGSVPEEDIADLRDALGTASEPDTPRSLQARIEHIESRVDEFDAYTGAIKEFIDDKGTAGDIVDDLNGRIDELSEEVAALSTDVTANDDSLGDLRSRVEEFEADAGTRFDELESSVERLDGVPDDVAALDDEVDDLSSSLGGLDDQFSSLDSRVGRLVDTVEQFEDDLDSVAESFDDLERRLDEMDEELSADGEQLQAEVESLRNDLQSIEGDVREIAEWRSQLGEMFK